MIRLMLTFLSLTWAPAIAQIPPLAEGMDGTAGVRIQVLGFVRPDLPETSEEWRDPSPFSIEHVIDISRIADKHTEEAGLSLIDLFDSVRIATQPKDEPSAMVGFHLLEPADTGEPADDEAQTPDTPLTSRTWFRPLPDSKLTFRTLERSLDAHAGITPLTVLGWDQPRVAIHEAPAIVLHGEVSVESAGRTYIHRLTGLIQLHSRGFDHVRIHAWHHVYEVDPIFPQMPEPLTYSWMLTDVGDLIHASRIQTLVTRALEASGDREGDPKTGLTIAQTTTDLGTYVSRLLRDPSFETTLNLMKRTDEPSVARETRHSKRAQLFPQDANATVTFELHAERRVRDGDVIYFDHPMFGFLIDIQYLASEQPSSPTASQTP